MHDVSECELNVRETDFTCVAHEILDVNERTTNKLSDVRPWDQAEIYNFLANVVSLINLAALASMSSPKRGGDGTVESRQMICQDGNEIHRGEAILCDRYSSLSPTPAMRKI